MRLFLIALLTMLTGVAHAQQASDGPPKLTILIGVDQFRAGYLERYNDAFTGGFRRLIDEGVWFRNAIVDHAPTLSLPGHTTLATGANPRTHGITSNAWIEPGQTPSEDGMLRTTIPHLDPAVITVGEESTRAFSPRHVKVAGLADWFKRADPNSKTVALSVTGLAVVYGGRPSGSRNDNHVYWLGSTGKFLTSSYYRDDYPAWLSRFNEQLADKYPNRYVWNNTVPEEFQSLARQDKAPYEFDGTHTSFPHKADNLTAEPNEKFYNWWFGQFSPYQNNALFDLARESIQQLQLGRGSSVDLLSLAIKLTDRVGHNFGPRSLEQLDVILRLDRLLGEFFDYLDLTIGKDNYLVALSADHGGPNISEFEQSRGRDAMRVQSQDIQRALQSVSTLIRDHKSEPWELPALIARDLERFPFIAKAMTREDLRSENVTDPVIAAYQNSFLETQPSTYPLWTKENRYGNLVSPDHPANYGVVVELAESANLWAAKSTHGGSYRYDREVPILFLGSNIKPRIATERAYTRDVAPTLARWAGVPIPNSVDGVALDP